MEKYFHPKELNSVQLNYFFQQDELEQCIQNGRKVLIIDCNPGHNG